VGSRSRWRGRTIDLAPADAIGLRRRAPARKIAPLVVLDRYISAIYLPATVVVTAHPPRRKLRENRTRFVVLGMLTTGPLTGYGLRQRIALSVGHFWQESYGQLYPTLRQLAAEGLVEARAASGGPGRGGATYHLTPKGRAALAAWVALPPVPEPQRNELLLKVFFAGAVPPEVTARNLEAVAAGLRGRLDRLEALAAHFDEATGAPHHPDAAYWRLTLDYGLSALRCGLDWIARAQGALRTRPRSRGPARLSTGGRRRPAHRSEGTR
jgi:DNA-binding PadR family transcriptional regulator